jgi:hypothetical protein
MPRCPAPCRRSKSCFFGPDRGTLQVTITSFLRFIISRFKSRATSHAGSGSGNASGFHSLNGVMIGTAHCLVPSRLALINDIPTVSHVEWPLMTFSSRISNV